MKRVSVTTITLLTDDEKPIPIEVIIVPTTAAPIQDHIGNDLQTLPHLQILKLPNHRRGFGSGWPTHWCWSLLEYCGRSHYQGTWTYLSETQGWLSPVRPAKTAVLLRSRLEWRFSRRTFANHRRNFHTDDASLSCIWSWALIGSISNYVIKSAGHLKFSRKQCDILAKYSRHLYICRSQFGQWEIFTSSVWNFLQWIADVLLKKRHSGRERRSAAVFVRYLLSGPVPTANQSARVKATILHVMTTHKKGEFDLKRFWNWNQSASSPPEVTDETTVFLRH